MTPLSRLAQPRYQMYAARGALIAACAVLAAACGSAAAPTGSTSTTPGAGPARSGSPAGSGSSASPAAAKVSLEVTLAGANTSTKHWTLRCDPPGGNSPDVAAACRALLANRSVLSHHHPMRIMCPMILADAPAFTVTGTFFGQKVHETIVDGGCDLGRWAALRGIFY